jgi:hypothetical protein
VSSRTARATQRNPVLKKKNQPPPPKKSKKREKRKMREKKNEVQDQLKKQGKEVNLGRGRKSDM